MLSLRSVLHKLTGYRQGPFSIAFIAQPKWPRQLDFWSLTLRHGKISHAQCAFVSADRVNVMQLHHQFTAPFAAEARTSYWH